MKKYVRDGRAPIPVKESISKVMSSNKSKNTIPELLLRKAFVEARLRGYRLHKKGLPGRPDISFSKKKLALFINGCYWHRCPTCNLPLPKSNATFWRDKFSKNDERDEKKVKDLQEMGWQVETIWECEIKKDAHEIVKKLKTKFF